MKSTSLLLWAILATAAHGVTPASAEETSPAKETAKEVGQDFKQFGKKFGTAVKQAGKDVGSATVTTTRSIKNKVKGDVQNKNFKPAPNSKARSDAGRS